MNKQKKVGNGNYLWISYFWSYLNDKGRAGDDTGSGPEQEERMKRMAFAVLVVLVVAGLALTGTEAWGQKRQAANAKPDGVGKPKGDPEPNWVL
ncbi:MAG: hypothetical protein ACE10G_04270, partial [Gemmatimonadales bacterium]